ncbi:MAG: hypothetical protein HFJ39_05050 [Bifidobacterium pseudolongum]|jgi:hypothetical protein|nr:hypothetical protein [Bifidobacterium pseudolongum]
MVMSIVAAMIWFVVCSVNALVEATVADDMRGRGRLGWHWLHMLLAIVFMGLAVAYSIIVLGVGYGFGRWSALTWTELAGVALLLSVRLVCLCMRETDGDGLDCGPNQGKES